MYFFRAVVVFNSEDYRQVSMTDLIVAALATWQIVEIWHHSALFVNSRAAVENWENKIGQLLSCPFCLSPYAAAAVLCCLTLRVPTSGLASWLAIFLSYVVLLAQAAIHAFAVARLANLGNDFFYTYCRTPRFTINEFFEESKEEDVTGFTLQEQNNTSG